jgi:hypothetical protein
VPKAQVLNSPIPVPEHGVALMGFRLSRSPGERINPLPTFSCLFEVEQLAMRLRVKRFTSVKVLQARNPTVKRAKKFDQLRETCSN